MNDFATDKLIIESLSSAICSNLSLGALRATSRDALFTVRSRVFDGGVLLLSAIGVVGMNNDWSESMVAHQYNHDARIASGKPRLSREVINDHLARPGFEAACERIYASLCKAAGLGRIGDGFKVADILKDRLGIASVSCIDGTEVPVSPSLRGRYKGTVEGSACMKIHSKLDLASGVEKEYSITPGTSSERDEALAMDNRGQLVIADAGYFSAGFCQQLESQGIYYLTKASDASKCLVASAQRVDRDGRAHPVEAPRAGALHNGLPDAKDVLEQDGFSYDVNGTTAGGFRHRECLVCTGEKDEETGRWRYVRLITNIPPGILDIWQVFELYRVRWQIELQFKAMKSYSHLQGKRIQTPGIIRGFMALCRCAAVLKLFIGQAMQEMLHLDLSMMKVQKYCNGIIGEIIRILLRGGKGLAKAIRSWKQDYADCAKEKPSFINRLRGKAVSCIAAILLRPSFTAEIHIPSPEDNQPPVKRRKRGRKPAAAAKAQA